MTWYTGKRFQIADESMLDPGRARKRVLPSWKPALDSLRRFEVAPVLFQRGKTRNLELMVMNDFSQVFLFTFRCNGEAHGNRLAETLVEQLAGYDVSVAADAYRRSWFGTEEALGPMLSTLGFDELDVKGVTAALHSHRDADRKLSVTPDQLQAAGFIEVAA